LRLRALAIAMLAAIPAAAATAQQPPSDGATDLPVFGPEVPRGSLVRSPAADVPPSAKIVDGELGDWSGSATRYGGSLVFSRGELVYQDHIWDAHGADDGGDASRLALLDPLADRVPQTYRLDPAYQADIPGQFGIPTPNCDQCQAEPRYGDLESADASDLAEVRVAADASDVFLLARTTTLASSQQTALLVLADTAAGSTERTVPFHSELKTKEAELAFLLAGNRGWQADLATDTVTPLPAGSVATNPAGYANAIEARLPRSLVGGERVRLAVASGPLDPNTVAADPSTAPPGFKDSGLPSNVANVAFRTDEPVREWFEKRQALALHARSIDDFFVAADLARLTAGASEDFRPGPGYHDRLFTSSERISSEGGSNGILQRYGVFLPSGYDGSAQRPLQLWLHWRGGTAHQGAALAPRIFKNLGEDRGAIVVSPHGRGTSRWYVGLGHADFREVWDDVHASFAVDEDRTYTAGHSMGGWGSYLLSILYPDRFAGAFPVAGPVTQGAWTGADFERCDEIKHEGEDATPCYIGANEGDPRVQHTRRLLENLRNVPLVNFHGAADELVPVTGVTLQMERMVELGYRHRYYLFPAYEHYSHPLVDQWSEGGRYLHSFTRDPNPSRVTYKRDMPFERATETVQSDKIEFDFDFDSAYWMSELEPVDEQQGVAYFDGSTRAKPAAPYVTTPEAGGPAAPGQTGPYGMTGLAWTPNPLADAPAASNGFDATVNGARAVKLDLARMQIDSGRRIDAEVKNDEPLELRLRGGWPSLPGVSVNGEPVPAALGDGVLTFELDEGTNRIVIEPPPPAPGPGGDPDGSGGSDTGSGRDGEGGGDAGGGSEGGAGGGTGSPIVLPSNDDCLSPRQVSLRIHQPRRGRIVAVRAYVNGRRVLRKVARRRGVRSVTIRGLPEGRFSLRVVAVWSNGHQTISTRRYDGCRKGRPKTRVRRGGRRR
jgi:poly(3-hydroxybutyrate) depolymerase